MCIYVNNSISISWSNNIICSLFLTCRRIWDILIYTSLVYYYVSYNHQSDVLACNIFTRKQIAQLSQDVCVWCVLIRPLVSPNLIARIHTFFMVGNSLAKVLSASITYHLVPFAHSPATAIKNTSLQKKNWINPFTQPIWPVW